MADLDPAQFDFTGTDSNLTITKKQIQCRSNSFAFLTSKIDAPNFKCHARITYHIRHCLFTIRSSKLGFLFFLFQNNYKSETILLVNQDLETILIFNKLSVENSILVGKITLENRAFETILVSNKLSVENSILVDKIALENRVLYTQFVRY